MGWMSADDHWWLGWREGFGMGLLGLVIPIVVCYIAMIVVFFRKGEVAVGILCTVFFVLFVMMWFGILIALLFGWRFAARWKIKAFMALWTGLVVMVILQFVAVAALAGIDGAAVRPLLSPPR